MFADLIRRIDDAIAKLLRAETGLGAYAPLMAQYGRGKNDPAALERLREGIVDLAAARYRGATAGATAGTPRNPQQMRATGSEI